MNVKPVVDEKNLRRKAPINTSLILIVGLKAYEAPQWAVGAVGMIILLLWILYVRDIILFKEQDVNIFKNK